MTSQAFGKENVVWGRMRVVPKITISEVCSDNIFLASDDDDLNSDRVNEVYYTSINPELELSLALAARNYIALDYIGDFRKYSEFDDSFKTDQHEGGLEWNFSTRKGSAIIFGGTYEDKAIQSFSQTGNFRDYTVVMGYADLLFKLKSFSEVGLLYAYTSRSFDDEGDKIDNFDRNRITANFLNKRWPYFPLLFEYSFVCQDNRNLIADSESLSRDFQSHNGFFGTVYDATARLSGHIKLGAIFVDFEDIDEYLGPAVESRLVYQYSDLLNYELALHQRPVISTRSLRETGSYYISRGIKFAVGYNKWERLPIALGLSYIAADYEDKANNRERKDNSYIAEMRIHYDLKDYMTFKFEYQFERRESDLDSVEYDENRIEIGIIFFNKS
jgi:hypothetical protein